MTIENRIGQYVQQGRAWYTRAVDTIKVFSIHHSASLTLNKTNDEILNELAQDHWKQGWPGLSYHFVITPDGTVFQINKFEEVTWVDSINWDCIGICVVGYFHAPYNQKPTDKQLVSLRELLDNLSTQHPEFPAVQNDAYGHRERFATACPGDLLFPYVLDYRAKFGAVDWGKDGIPASHPSAQLTNARVAAVANPQPGSFVPVNSVTPDKSSTEPLKYTETEYQEIVRERDEARQLLQEKATDNTALNKNYSGFVTLGYTTVDDLQKVLKEKDDTNLGLQKQILQLKQSRVTLLDQFKAVDLEDTTALENGIKAIEELKTVKQDYNTTVVALGAKKRNIFSVLNQIDNLKHIAHEGVKALENEHVITDDQGQKGESILTRFLWKPIFILNSLLKGGGQ